MKTKKYYSQPDVPTSITCWSFTWMIFLFSMLIWLEITVFQVWTLSFLIVFLIIAFIELKGRYLQITNEKVKFHALIIYNNQEIEREKIQSVTCNKWGVVKIHTENETYEFLMMPKTAKKVVSELS